MPKPTKTGPAVARGTKVGSCVTKATQHVASRVQRHKWGTMGRPRRTKCDQLGTGVQGDKIEIVCDQVDQNGDQLGPDGKNRDQV